MANNLRQKKRKAKNQLENLISRLANSPRPLSPELRKKMHRAIERNAISVKAKVVRRKSLDRSKIDFSIHLDTTPLIDSINKLQKALHSARLSTEELSRATDNIGKVAIQIPTPQIPM